MEICKFTSRISSCPSTYWLRVSHLHDPTGFRRGCHKHQKDQEVMQSFQGSCNSVDSEPRLGRPSKPKMSSTENCHEWQLLESTILDVLRYPRYEVLPKRLGLCVAKAWQLLQDNSPAHFSYLIQQFLTKYIIPILG